ncbi:MFS transporter [Actinocrispum wychmicini]|uniref:Putative MFS family arabinose efflux permease n=1 Tax=Actinocrispum wychmicini TaxID=1213861 RepID=A0A4R2JXL2_9PSEU|nr:MFS transporter [Actinocrispum wychmicini]TCO65293.1 putative MFS family arabinose efflux permease [Actinocrispum wychmicini]
MTTACARPPILNRALLLRFVSVVASSVSFYLPLAVIPMYAGTSGTATAAGLANGVLLVATVLGELVTPRIVTLVGYRWALGAGLVLLGAPALALLGSMSVPMIFAVGVLRGIGFAITMVAGGALTAALIPDERRGEGLAIVGLVGGVPSLLALPLGVWMAGHWGYGIVFVLTAAFPIVAVVTVLGLPDREKADSEQHGVLGGLRNGALTRPALIFAAAAGAAGVVVTYLPLATQTWVAPIALFVQPAAATVGRWFAGKIGDRHGQVRMLVPSVGLAILGMVLMAATHEPAFVFAGAALFGIGFGVLQNASISLMYARVPAAGYSTVSAIWNAAYDLGMAAGSIGVGVIVTATSFPMAFVLTAAAMVPAAVMSWREGRLLPSPRP